MRIERDEEASALTEQSAANEEDADTGPVEALYLLSKRQGRALEMHAEGDEGESNTSEREIHPE